MCVRGAGGTFFVARLVGARLGSIFAGLAVLPSADFAGLRTLRAEGLFVFAIVCRVFAAALATRELFLGVVLKL